MKVLTLFIPPISPKFCQNIYLQTYHLYFKRNLKNICLNDKAFSVLLKEKTERCRYFSLQRSFFEFLVDKSTWFWENKKKESLKVPFPFADWMRFEIWGYLRLLHPKRRGQFTGEISVRPNGTGCEYYRTRHGVQFSKMMA